MKRGTQRALSLLSAAAMSTTLLLTPVATEATTGVMRHCKTSEMRTGKTFRTVDLKEKRFVMTHSTRVRIAAGTEFSRQVEMVRQTRVGASISAKVSTAAEAGKFFAKASAEAEVAVAANGERTKGTTITEKFTIAKAKRDRRFVFYTGVDWFRFRAHKRVCGGQEYDYYGPLKSWNTVYETGNVRCPSSLYRRGTIAYQVTSKSGC